MTASTRDTLALFAIAALAVLYADLNLADLFASLLNPA
jgi:hypothetical protein